jgi:flavodoxin
LLSKENEMKALVTYYSETGNTKELARAIFEGVQQVEKEILSIQEVKNVDDYDLVFCGFPVKLHSVPPKAATFLKMIPEGKKLAVFVTHGSIRGGRLAVTAFEDVVTLVPKAKLLGTFGCRGKVKPGIIEKLVEKAEYKGWAEEAWSSAGHPDDADLVDGKDFARRMVTKARAQ